MSRKLSKLDNLGYGKCAFPKVIRENVSGGKKTQVSTTICSILISHIGFIQKIIVPEKKLVQRTFEISKILLTNFFSGAIKF